jgi:hypothetical protein
VNISVLEVGDDFAYYRYIPGQLSYTCRECVNAEATKEGP